MTDTPSTTQRDHAPVDDDTPAPPGRPVRLVPTPSGFWRTVGGAIVAVLAPFFGILIGSTMGNEDPASRMDPLYWGFFIGIVVGGVGLVSVGLGVRQLMRNPRTSPVEEEER